MAKGQKRKQSKSARRSSRKRLTLAQKHELLMEAGYRCGNPRCPIILAVHPTFR
jgi:hypothetical protein